MTTTYDVVVGTGHAGCEEASEMDEIASVTNAPRTAADYRAAIHAIMAQIRRMNEQSERTWSEIERLKAESVALQAENEVIKARIDRRLEALAGLL